MKPDKKKLIEDHKRLIEAEAFNHSKFIPLAVMKAEAFKLADEAADNFDHNAGVKFSTYLTNQLKKLSRISTQYGNAVRLPENKQFKINRINHIEKDLESQLHRTPSVAELADASGMSLAEINGLLQSRKKEVAASNITHTPIFVDNSNDEWLHFVYHDLADRDKLIFEHKTGFGGKEVLSNEDLAKKLGSSTSTINNRVKIITDKIAEGWQNEV